MHVLVPLDVTDAVLTDSSLAETDYPAWSSTTAYGTGERRLVASTTLPKLYHETWEAGQRLYWDAAAGAATTILIAGAQVGRAASPTGVGTTTGSVAVHAVFEAVAPSTGINPVSDAAVPADAPGRKWARVGATARWKAFDERVGDRVSASGTLTYTLTVPRLCTGIAFFGLKAATVSVLVRNQGGAVVWSGSNVLVGTDSITDWYTFFTWDPTAAATGFESEALLTGLPAYPGYRVEVTIEGTEPEVGEIVLGHVIRLGSPLFGTEPGFDDWSGTARDDWGHVDLVPREATDWCSFQFRVAFDDLRRVMRVIRDRRGKPSVWFAGEELGRLGTTIYGFPSGSMRTPLTRRSHHVATVTIEGL